MTLRKLASACSIVLAIMACGGQEQDIAQKDNSKQKDSLALHVAVYPSEGCLPLYYAEQTGMFDSLKADISLIHLQTMEDCDTALMRHHVEVSASDLARLFCMRKDKFRATAIAQLHNSLGLYSAKGMRINEVKQLKERLVALERHSESDYYSDKLVELAKMERLAIFRTQFNNHKLREEMLTNKLVDGAFLDEPYATLALERGAKQIWMRDAASQPWTVLAMPTALLQDKHRTEQARTLMRIYDIAAKEMQDSTKNQVALAEVLKKRYAIPYADVDTLEAVKKIAVTSHPLSLVPNEMADVVKSWLVGRGWISQSLLADSLVINLTTK